MSACTGQPISWMRLEQYALGELPEPERVEVSNHLEGCHACSECFARIEQAPAPDLSFLQSPVVQLPARPAARRRPWPVWAGAVLASAAAVLLLLVRPDAHPPARLHVKGGDFALELARLDGAGRVQPPTHFAAGDRFKALVTCPPDWSGVVGIVVYQGEQKYEPLAIRPFDDCGNRRVLEGAFAIDGKARALVCASFAKNQREWHARVDQSAAAPPSGSVCTSLAPSANEDR
jgi:hypothetical protein